MKRFQDKTAIVTGAAMGIGRGLAHEFARAGGKVLIADINDEQAQLTAQHLASDTGQPVEALHVDVTSNDDLRAAVDRVRQRWGALDYMFNNAGVAIMGEVRDTSLEDYQRLVDVNLMGVVAGTKIAYDVMLEQGHGHIVNTSSITGLHTYPVMAAYSSTKFAVVGYSLALRAEAASLGVQVSVICPQNVRSNMTEGIPVRGVDDPDFFKNLPSRWTDANEGARQMLAGVARNEALIVVPSRARLLWWLYRMNPTLVEAVGKGGVRIFRRFRSTGAP